MDSSRHPGTVESRVGLWRASRREIIAVCSVIQCPNHDPGPQLSTPTGRARAAAAAPSRSEKLTSEMFWSLFQFPPPVTYTSLPTRYIHGPGSVGDGPGSVVFASKMPCSPVAVSSSQPEIAYMTSFISDAPPGTVGLNGVSVTLLVGKELPKRKRTSPSGLPRS